MANKTTDSGVLLIETPPEFKILKELKIENKKLKEKIKRIEYKLNKLEHIIEKISIDYPDIQLSD